MAETDQNSVGVFQIILDASQLNNTTTKDELIAKYEKLYTFKEETPRIEIKGNTLIIQVNSENFAPFGKKLNQAIALCEQRKLDSAESLLMEIIANCPFHSEAYRLLAQIQMERNLIDEVKKIYKK